MAKERRHDIGGAILWGGTLIVVGIVLLLNSMGILSWDLWGFLWRFWPVFIIIWGLDMVLGHSLWGGVLAGVLGLFVIIGVIAYSILAFGNLQTPRSLSEILNFNREVETEHKAVMVADYPDVEQRKLNIDLPTGELEVSELAADYVYLDITASHPKGAGVVKLEPGLQGNTLNLDFGVIDPANIFAWGDRKYAILVGRAKLPTEFTMDVSSGSAKLHIYQIEVKKLNIQLSSGSVDVQLGNNISLTEQSRIHVSSGTLSLALAKEVGLKVEYDVSSGVLNLPGHVVSNGRGVFTSSNYDSAGRKFELDLNVSSGLVSISQ